MTMGDETPVTSLVLPVLLRPILSQVINSISFFFSYAFFVNAITFSSFNYPIVERNDEKKFMKFDTLHFVIDEFLFEWKSFDYFAKKKKRNLLIIILFSSSSFFFLAWKARCGCITNTSGGFNESRTSKSRTIVWLGYEYIEKRWPKCKFEWKYFKTARRCFRNRL